MGNPYAAPRADVEVAARDRCWSEDGKVLYVARGSDLPARCVKCNLPVAARSKTRWFYWHSSWWYLLILFNLLVYAVVGLIVRKKVQLSPALCEAHRRRRQVVRWTSFSIFGVMIATGLATMGGSSSSITLLAFLIAIVAFFVTILGSRIVYPIGIDERGARFKGCGEAFLKSLGHEPVVGRTAAPTGWHGGMRAQNRGRDISP